MRGRCLEQIASANVPLVVLQMANVADLVRRMLEPDATQRISMSEILAHPWYRLGLPAKLASLNDRLLADR